LADEYIEAARNKISIARRFMHQLNQLRAGDEREREEIQPNFEGVLTSSFSAADQLAAAAAHRLGLNVGHASPGPLLRAVDERGGEVGGLAACLALLRQWTCEPVVVDARRQRNLAVHDHYEKRPYKPELTWVLDPVLVQDKPSPYRGPRDVHSYCALFAAELAKLESAAGFMEGSR
jgi:hypothetical protein